MSVFLAELPLPFLSPSYLACYLPCLFIDTLADGDGVLEVRERRVTNRSKVTFSFKNMTLVIIPS